MKTHRRSDYNYRLWRMRAEVVRNYLLAAGIRPERIARVVSYGDDRPTCNDNGAKCLRQNRRAVVVVVVTDKK